MNLAPMAALGTHLGKHVHQVARAFREGGGVPYSEYRPGVHRRHGRHQPGASTTACSIDAVPPARPGPDASGSRRASASPTSRAAPGHALVVLARAFPASTFVGYDLDDGAIGRATGRGGGRASSPT